jgi:hypothetical protein
MWQGLKTEMKSFIRKTWNLLPHSKAASLASWQRRFCNLLKKHKYFSGGS